MKRIVCGRCKAEKDSTEYYSSNYSKSGLLTTCKSCEIEKKKAWIARNPEKHAIAMKHGKEKYNKKYPERVAAQSRNTKLKKKYAIEGRDYSEMMSKQNGVCAICFKKEHGRHMAIDHDHSSGCVRGILCSKCNTGIGGFRDSVDVLERALQYLMNHSDNTTEIQSEEEDL